MDAPRSPGRELLDLIDEIFLTGELSTPPVKAPVKREDLPWESVNYMSLLKSIKVLFLEDGDFARRHDGSGDMQRLLTGPRMVMFHADIVVYKGKLLNRFGWKPL